MYDYLTGRLVERGPDEVVLDVGGVGYQLLVSGATSGRLPAAAAGPVAGAAAASTGHVTLFVHDMTKEERTVLYGFASREERRLFLKLMTVSRIGPGIALSMLSALEPGALAAAVEGGDVAALARVRGVGRRTAERLCVELKGRLAGIEALPGAFTDLRAAVCSALVALGYPRPVAQKTADRVCGGAPRETRLDELLKRGLRELASAPATADPLA